MHDEADGRLVLGLLSQETADPFAQAAVAQGRAQHRAWVARGFGPCRPDGLDEAALDALSAATDLYVWKLLRLDLGRPPAAVAATIEPLVRGVRATPSVPVATPLRPTDIPRAELGVPPLGDMTRSHTLAPARVPPRTRYPAFMLPLLAALAAAQELPLPTPEPRAADGAWVHTYEAGMNTARTGAIVGGAGVVASTIGVVLLVNGLIDGNAGPFLLGGVALAGGGTATWVGAPIMAGGSLRAARGLEDGGYVVSRTPGYLAWGLWSGSMLLSASGLVMTSADPAGGTALPTLSALAFLGSYAAGGAQMAVNGAAFRRGMPMVYVGPVPMKDGAGATVALRF